VEGDRLYYLTPAAEVVCADTGGKIVWRLDLCKHCQVRPYCVAGSSPLVAGDLVFLVTGNGRDPDDEGKPVPQPKAPSFIAVRKKSGEVAWADSSPGANILQAQWASPAYADVKGRPQVIFLGGDGWLYSFEPATGELLWKFDSNPKNARFKLGGNGNRNYFLAAPVVSGNRVYIGTGQNPGDGMGEGHLWCVDATRLGDISPELGAAPGEPNPNSGVVWHYGGRAPVGSDRDWVFGRTASTCAIAGGLVYAAEQDGYLHCLDARTGKPYWVADLKWEVLGSPLWADGRVYVGTGEGTMFVFAHGKERKLQGKFDVNEAVLAPAVVANGVLYVTTDRRLYAIGSREKAKP
jgi:outer membrane protein assembly factor BamB